MVSYIADQIFISNNGIYGNSEAFLTIISYQIILKLV